MSDLTHCQQVVERMLTNARPMAEIEDYIEECVLDQMEKAGLWMLAWAHQDQATQLRLARETLALLRSTRATRSSAPVSGSGSGTETINVT